MHLGLPFMSTACPLACRLIVRVFAMWVWRTPETTDEPHDDAISRTFAANAETIAPPLCIVGGAAWLRARACAFDVEKQTHNNAPTNSRCLIAGFTARV